MTSTTATLAQAYGKIRPDLERVQDAIAEQLASAHPEVAVLCDHLSQFRGKMLRPALLLLTARATGHVRPIHIGLAGVIEMFHLATLVHDDVLDEAKIRRQAVTINQGWGNEAAVMLGDWLISQAYHLCSRQGNQWANLEISTVAHRVCEGELMQLFRRGQPALPIDDYLQIIRLKTAALIGLSARLGARFNSAPPEIEQACLDYGTDLGIAFQIGDDVLDLVGDEGEVGKTLGTDLAGGKATLPLIHFLQTADAEDQALVRRLWDQHALGKPPAGHSNGDGLSLLARRLVASGCVQSAEAVARSYVESAKRRLDILPPGDARTSLQLVADFVMVRNQ